MAKHCHHTKVQGALFAGMMTLALGTMGFQWALSGKIAPNTLLNNTLVAFEDAEVVQEAFSQSLTTYETLPIRLTYGDQTKDFALSDLGITFDKTTSVQSIPVIGPSASPWAMEGGLFGEKKITPQFTVDEKYLAEALNGAFLGLNQAARDARLVWSDSHQNFEIEKEESGWHLNKEALMIPMMERLERLEPMELILITEPETPRIKEADLEAARPQLEEKIRKVVTVSAEGSTWEVRWTDFLAAFIFEPRLMIQADGVMVPLQNPPSWVATQTDLNIRLNATHFADFIEKKLATTLEIQSEDATITEQEDGTINFEGTATDGVVINRGKFMELLELALNRGIELVELPLVRTPGRVNASQALRDRGITELVSTGYSGYYGSPPNRQHNIRTAIGRYNGLWVEPGEVFSFGAALGAVDGSTGYLKELVIKEGETIPEYGGGVCQVSSTLFRAVLFGGLPIVERHPHSYAVAYYAYPLGYGLDATVYPPQVDLKFKNDMATPLLIQAFQEGTEAYFKFYGTKDGREATLEGPFISNRQGPPPVQFLETTSLAPGEKKKVDSAHNGFTAEWKRRVTYPDGQTATDTIVSHYRAWAEKWQVGVDKTE